MRPATTILVLGGGLAGAAAAILLARAGRHVTLLERETEPRHKVCGEFLSAEALTLLHVLGIDPEAHGAEPVRTVALASGKHCVQAALPFPACSLTRRCLDGLLLRAAADAGADIREGLGVEALQEKAGHWHASLSDGSTVAAPVALLATGKHDLRGFPRPHGTQNGLLSLKMYFRLAPAQAAELQGAVELLLHRYAYTGLQRVEGGMANLTILVQQSRLAQLGGWTGLLGALQAENSLAATRLHGAQPALPKPLAISSIPYGFVRRKALRPTLYAVGDQAAVIPSFTGDGMSIALFSGICAARAILAGQSADAYQEVLYRGLHPQVSRATLLSRTLVQAAGRSLLMAGARVWPGGIARAAMLTRIPAGLLRPL